LTGSIPRLRAISSTNLGGESVGDKTDPAQRIGAHPGVAIELLHQLVRNVVAFEVGTQHGDEVLAARHLVAHRMHEGADTVNGDAVVPGGKLAGLIEARLQRVG
jgi:hypothetical protein